MLQTEEGRHWSSLKDHQWLSNHTSDTIKGTYMIQVKALGYISSVYFYWVETRAKKRKGRGLCRKNQDGVKGNKKGWFCINNPLVCLDWAPCAWSELLVLFYVWVYSDPQARRVEADKHTDRHNFFQIQLYPVMWAAIKMTWFEGKKKSEQKKCLLKILIEKLPASQRAVRLGTGARNQKHPWKMQLAPLKYSWVPRNHIHLEIPLCINGMATYHLKNLKQSGKPKITKRKENFIHPWTSIGKK